jgi:putative transcriptional regulator
LTPDAATATDPAAAPYDLTGRLLVATPNLHGPAFAQTIIFIVHHNQEGAFGLVINRPIGTSPIADLLEEAGADAKGVSGEIAVHYGGPVELDYGFVLHSADYEDASTVIVDQRFAMTANTEILRAISGDEGPSQSLFVFGYAGWAPNQLEGELADNAWFVIPADEELVFGADAETKWQRALARREIAI